MYEKLDSAIFGYLPGFRRLSFMIRSTHADMDDAGADAYLRRQVERSVDPTAQALAGASWREAYEMFGMEAKAVPPFQALRAWIESTGGLPSQGPVRDLVHGFMMEWTVPVAAYALDHVQGDLWLRPSRGCERFTGMDGKGPTAPEFGELILVDTSELVLARNWHGAQGLESVPRQSMSAILVHIDLLPYSSHRYGSVEDGFTALAGQLLGGEITRQRICRLRPEIVWPDRG
jgi:DNA/RNA-binding domain of Phe-tRNA-synthetase-like protein